MLIFNISDKVIRVLKKKDSDDFFIFNFLNQSFEIIINLKTSQISQTINKIKL